MAVFYAAYAKKGDDGYYHIIPSMEPERWGFYAGLARNKDVISSLCMFRWALNRTAEASEILGVDEKLRGKWREIAENLAPYPTWDTPGGPVFTAVHGVKPHFLEGDHFGEAAEYPTILADEINLDSPRELKDMMIRTARMLEPAGTTEQTLALLGVTQKTWDYDEMLRGVTQKSWNGDAEALLNSRGGRIHLFPAISTDAEIAFNNFQARGGFLVSAAKNAQEVYFLKVQPQRDNICRIMNPWPGRQVTVIESVSKKPVKTSVDKSNGECIVFQGKAGDKYMISAND